VDRPDLAQSIYERNRLQEQEERRELIARLLGPASLASAILILVGFYLLEEQVEEEAALAKQGVSVDGVGFIVPFIDARTTRAKVTWLGDKEKRPTELESPHLTYLGRGRDVTVLLACGRTTVLVPANNVAIDLFNTDRDMPEDQQRQQFNDLCGG
jgi:hypothetical protein